MSVEELKKEFDEYFEFIIKFAIDSEENYNEIRDYYSKGLLRFKLP